MDKLRATEQNVPFVSPFFQTCKESKVNRPEMTLEITTDPQMRPPRPVGETHQDPIAGAGLAQGGGYVS